MAKHKFGRNINGSREVVPYSRFLENYAFARCVDGRKINGFYSTYNQDTNRITIEPALRFFLDEVGIEACDFEGFEEIDASSVIGMGSTNLPHILNMVEDYKRKRAKHDSDKDSK